MRLLSIFALSFAVVMTSPCLAVGVEGPDSSGIQGANLLSNAQIRLLLQNGLVDAKNVVEVTALEFSENLPASVPFSAALNGKREASVVMCAVGVAAVVSLGLACTLVICDHLKNPGKLCSKINDAIDKAQSGGPG